MERYATHPFAETDVHGGAFFWRKLRWILEIDSSGATELREEVIAPPSELGSESQSMQGKVISSTAERLELELGRDGSPKKMTVSALRHGDELICAYHSQFNDELGSFLFSRQ